MSKRSEYEECLARQEKVKAHPMARVWVNQESRYPGYQMREVYLHSIQKVRDQKVDIFMPNHTNNVDLLNKRQYMLDHPGENPFVDDQAWKNYLDMKYVDLLKLMADPAQN